MSVYSLDLETLLPLLEEFHQNGRLTTTLATGIPGLLKDRCDVRVDLYEGKVVYCHVTSKDGRIQIQGSDALRLAYDIGVQEWKLDASQAVAPSGPKTSTALPKGPGRDTSPVRRPTTEGYTVPLQSSQPPYRTTSPLRRQGSGYDTMPVQRINPERTDSFMNGFPTGPTGYETMPLRTPPATNGTFLNTWRTQQSQQASLLVPQRVAYIEPQKLYALSRRHRRVLVLVDGKRTVEQIALILYSSVRGIQAVLEDLQELELMGLVALE